MLLNNNNEMDNVVYRRAKQSEPGRNKTSGGPSGGPTGSTSATNRNSWSFTNDVVAVRKSSAVAVAVVAKEQSGIYADPEGLKCGSRARLRQRSVSNLTQGVKSREHSTSGYSAPKQGTIKCDYIRINPSALRLDPDVDRAEFGSPDGHSNPESASSTAERELPALPVPELYQAINQNKSNDFKVTQHRRMPPSDPHLPATTTTSATTGVDADVTLRQRSTSGRNSGRKQGNWKSSVPTCTSAGSHSGGSSAVKTEWTFLPSAPSVAKPEISSTPEESSLVRKGLLWIMRDRMFCRWHERYCILTRNYLHCFKKATETSLTQMGNFLFKVSLAEVMAVQWLDKRGTAIVCLNLVKDGRLLVKTSLDLNGWFDTLQTCVKETIGRRQTLMMDRKNGNESELLKITTTTPVKTPVKTPSSTPSKAPPPPSKTTSSTPSTQALSSNRLHMGHGSAVQPIRDRSAAPRSRQANRYSLMSDVEMIKTTTDGGLTADPLRFIPPAATSSPQSKVAPVSIPVPVPVPVPYRERSSSFDRSRASKVEREAKRRSYYPNHVTQV